MLADVPLVEISCGTSFLLLSLAKARGSIGNLHAIDYSKTCILRHEGIFNQAGWQHAPDLQVVDAADMSHQHLLRLLEAQLVFVRTRDHARRVQKNAAVVGKSLPGSEGAAPVLASDENPKPISKFGSEGHKGQRGQKQ
jgi:hypothetical protein